MKKMSEGNKMFLTVMLIFISYTVIFIIFDDIDRNYMNFLDEPSERNLLLFALVVTILLGTLLYRYAKRMDYRIEKERERENEQERWKTRRQLTQNISHELKTPVSSILGYTETIINNPELSQEVKQQFIQRCHAQAVRLTNLLQDISTLNRIDHAPDLVEMYPVDIVELVDEIVEETSFALEQREMTFQNNLPKSLLINGNAPLLYSIFRNLIDNAINYAGNNTTITLNAEHQQDVWNFHFYDNGVGIPPTKTERIFERFYRIDKGRSRLNGGTGLGLAIVKNAVYLHGGTINAKVNEGLHFYFTLKE